MRVLSIGAFVALVWGVGLAIHGSPARAQETAGSSNAEPFPLLYSPCEEALPNVRRNHGIGSYEAANLLGQLYETGQCVRQNFERAAELYEEAAAQNHEGAQLLLGQLYVLGLGVPKDLGRARILFRRAALTFAEGGVQDYINAAKYYLRSREVPGLLAEELLPFQEIADGPAEQKYEFALRWRDGRGLPKSREGYLNWLSEAALGRFPPAQYEFGLARLAGEIGILGAFDGVEWIWYAARAGHVPAQADLARHLETGKGTEPSAIQALAWYLIAQRNGAEVSESIERLTGLLSETERRDARRRSLNRILLTLPRPLEGTPVPPLLRP